MVPMIFSCSSPVLQFETTTHTHTHHGLFTQPVCVCVWENKPLWFTYTPSACYPRPSYPVYGLPLVLQPLSSHFSHSHPSLTHSSRDALPVFSFHTSTRVSLTAAGNNGNGAALCRTETDALLCVCLGLSADRLIAIFRTPLSRFNTMGCCSGRCTLIFLCTFQLVSLFPEKICAFHLNNSECC